MMSKGERRERKGERLEKSKGERKDHVKGREIERDKNMSKGEKLEKMRKGREN